MASDEEKLAVLNDYRSRNGWPPLTELGGRDPRAVAKLTKRERCEIKAFCLLEVPRKIIAAAFDVHTHTVMNIHAAGYKKYPDVFKAVMSFNTVDEFCWYYITAEKVEAIKKMWPQLEALDTMKMWSPVERR